MQFFRRLTSGAEVTPFLAEVNQNESLWLANTARQDRIAEQRHTNTIFLRTAVKREDIHINENQESQFTAIAKHFPRATNLMLEIARQLNAELCRATIVRLSPNSKVYRHIDSGSYYLIRDRFHFVLQSPSGSLMGSGGEQIRMQAGELWWFDNKQHHWAENDSGDWRIHFIFDLLPARHKHLARNPVHLSAPQIN